MRSLLLLLLLGLIHVASAFEWIKNFGNWKFGGGGGDDQADDVTDEVADDLPSDVAAEARRDIFSLIMRIPLGFYPLLFQGTESGDSGNGGWGNFDFGWFQNNGDDATWW